MADPPVVKGESSANTALPSSALAPARRAVGELRLPRAPQRALPDQDRDLAAEFKTSAAGASRDAGCAVTGVHEDEVRAPGFPIDRLSAASFIICTSLAIVRCATPRSPAPRGRPGWRRRWHVRPGHLDVVERDRLHQLGRIDALLIARPDKVMKGHAGDRDDGRAVESGVVEPIEQMDGAGPVVPTQTPSLPVCLAKPEAMKAAASSCRTPIYGCGPAACAAPR